MNFPRYTQSRKRQWFNGSSSNNPGINFDVFVTSIIFWLLSISSTGNVRPCVTGHPAWRDATDTPQHNKRNNGLDVCRLFG